VTCVLNQASGVASEAITPHADSGAHIAIGQVRQWVMPTSDVAGFFAVDGVGTGVLEITLAEGP
jgi:hypothetical protein